MSITNKRAASPSTPVSANSPEPAETEPFRLPVETEIYILPDGRVIVADLPAQLADLPAALGPADETETTGNG